MRCRDYRRAEPARCELVGNLDQRIAMAVSTAPLGSVHPLAEAVVQNGFGPRGCCHYGFEASRDDRFPDPGICVHNQRTGREKRGEDFLLLLAGNRAVGV